MNNKTYQDAVTSIRAYSESRQAELDAQSASARAANIAATRRLATEGITEDSPLYPVAALVAQTISIGRKSDGFPDCSLPTETTAVLQSALRAGLLKVSESRVMVGGLEFYNDFSGLSTMPPSHAADYQAWSAAKEYRRLQNWDKL